MKVRYFLDGFKDRIGLDWVYLIDRPVQLNCIQVNRSMNVAQLRRYVFYSAKAYLTGVTIQVPFRYTLPCMDSIQ